MPSKEWNNDLTLLTVTVRSKIRGGALPPPSWVEKNIQSHQTGWHAWYWYLVLSTASSSGGIHPGAVIGIDTFLQAVCKETFPVQMLGCPHSIADCISVIWTLAAKVHKGACGICSNPLPELPPRRAKLYHMPCCEQVVHAHCWADKRVYAACCTGLVPLPCVVC